MSYSDRKEGNWDYQRVSGQLKAQEKAQKEAIKAAEKAQKKAAKSSRRSYSAPKNLTVEQVMADYNSWNAKQPQTAEQVMADFNAWNTDADAWMKSQTPVQTSAQGSSRRVVPMDTFTTFNQGKQDKKEEHGATRIHFDPTKQERPDPSAITKGGIPELGVTDSSSAYSQVMDYKEKRRKAEEDKASQEERHAKNKAARLEKQLERTEKAKARKDWTYKAPAQSNFPVYNAPEEKQGAYSDLSDRELTAAIASIDPLRTSRMGFNENMQRRALGNELSYRNAQAFQEATTKRPDESDLEYRQRMQTQVSPEQATAMLAQVRRNAQVPDEAEASELVNKPDFTEQDRNIALEILNEYDQDTIRKNRTLSALRERVLSDNPALAFTAGVDSQLMNRYYAADRAVANLTGGNNLSERTAALDPMSGYTQNRIMAANAANAGNIQEAEMLNNAADEQARKYNFKEGTQAAAMDNGLAYGAGRIAGAVGENMMVGNLLSDAGWTVNTGNKVADFLGNQGIKLIPDIVSDTIPTVAEAYDEGQRGLDLAKTAGLNVLENELYNLGTDYLLAPAFNKIFGGAKQASPEYLNSLREYQQNVLEPLAREADDAAAAAQTAAKNVDVDNLATAGRQTVNNLDELAEQATKQAPIEQVKPIAPAASTAEEVVEQAAKTDVAPNGLRYPEQDNPIIDSIETARKGMEEGIPKATSQLDTHQMQVDNVLSKYDFNANEETKVLVDSVQNDYKAYKEAIQIGDTEAADATAKKLRSDLGKLHRRAEKYVPDYKGELNVRDITQGSNYPAYSIRNMKNAKIDADSVMNNWNNSFLASEFGEMTREQYDAFLKEAQDLGWVDELGNPTKEALGSIPSSEYDDILSQYDDIVKNALEQGNTERDTAASILDSLEQEQKAGRVYLNDKEWYDMVGAANNYARTGEKQYLEQMNDIVSAKRVAEAPVDIAPVKAEPVNNAPVQVEQIAPQKAVPVDEGRGPLRERNFAKDVRDYRVEGLPNEVVEDFEKNRRVYKQLKNADTAAKADASIAKGFDEAMQDFNTMLDRMDPAAVPLGQKLAQQLSEQGDYFGAADIIDRVAERLTKSGQFSQAAVIALMKDDPMAALHYIQRQINKLNAEGARKWGKKWTDFDLTKDEMDMFSKIAPGDKEAIKNAYDMIGERFGAAYPSSMLDKMLEARRIGMLLNSGTLVRNFLANPPTMGMRWTADRFDAVGQNIVHLIDPSFEVTNAITGSGIRGRRLAQEFIDSEAGKKLFEEANVSKYMDDFNNEIIKNRTVFKGTRFEHWIDDMTDGGIQKLNKKLFGKSNVQSIPETMRNLTYKLLEAGDTPYVRENFKQRLGSYINAQKITSIDQIPQEAIDFAWEEAMKATYKDNSWAVQAISGLRKGLGKVPVIGKPLAEGTIPFVQAPGNIAARMVDYSPIRGSKGVYDVVRGAITKDNNTIRKGIEEMSKGLTGTGLVYLGMKLREAGVLTGAFSSDKDEKAFQKQTGFQEFAIRAGDKYYSYDWAQPFAEALLVGTLLQDAIENSDEYDSEILRHFGYEGTTAGKVIGGAVEGAKQSVDSWFNASPLKGLRDLFGKNGYGEADGDFSENVLSLLGGFGESFIPASLNATAKSIDTVQRNTYDPQNDFTSRLNAMQAKIPELSKELPAKYDTWGREMTYASNSADAAFAKFINPGKYSENQMTDTDREIERIYNETGNNAVFPHVAPKKVNDYTLNNSEMSEYQKDMGERSLELAEAFMDSSFYEDLDDNDRAKFLGQLYGVSEAITKRDMFDAEVSDTYAKDVEIYEKYGADTFMNYLKTKENAKYKTESGNTTSSTYSKVNALSDLSDRTLDKLLPEFLNLTNDEGEPNLAGRIYDQYGARTLIDFYQNGYKATGRKEHPQTKAEASEAALMFPKNMQEDMLRYYLEQQKRIISTKPSKAEEEVLATKGVSGFDKYVEQEDTLHKYGSYTYDQKAQNIYKQGGIPALEEYGKTLQELEQAGAKGGKAYDAYEHAKEVDPSITTKKFAAQYKYIDSLGNSNGELSQKEIIAAMNARPNDAQAIEALYWTSEKTIPVLKNGKWTTKTVKKKK